MMTFWSLFAAFVFKSCSQVSGKMLSLTDINTAMKNVIQSLNATAACCSIQATLIKLIPFVAYVAC